MKITLGHFFGEGLILHIGLLIGIIFFKRFNAFFQLLVFQLIIACIFYWILYAIPYVQGIIPTTILQTPAIIGVYYFLQANFVVIGFREIMKVKIPYWPVYLFYLTLLVAQVVLSADIWQLSSPDQNLWIANLYVLAEMIVLILTLRELGDKVIPHSWLQLGFVIFLSVYLAFQSFLGINRLVTYPMMVGGLIFIFLYFRYLYALVQGEAKIPLEFWAFTGMTLYFAGYSPYFGMFDFLNKNYPTLSSKLYLTLVQGLLNNLRYTFVAFTLIALIDTPKADVKT